MFGSSLDAGTSLESGKGKHQGLSKQFK